LKPRDNMKVLPRFVFALKLHRKKEESSYA
jgi:hypothetical protein